MKRKKEKQALQKKRLKTKELRLKTGLKAGCQALLQTGDYEGYGRCMAGGWSGGWW
jgi:hypothetical protein